MNENGSRPRAPRAVVLVTVLLSGLSLAAGGCASSPGAAGPGDGAPGGASPQSRRSGAEAPATEPSAVPIRHENLNAVLWAQSSVEFEAAALQAYASARRGLREGLADPDWTALPRATAGATRSTAEPGRQARPPAVILDVDETVLDNSPYQARLILDGEEFGPASWGRWVNEAIAEPVPGALSFCREAAAAGVTVFYVTNRDAELEDGTRRNLRRLGFPVEEGFDVVLTRGEIPAWDTSDKTPRRRHVAADFRVLLLVGDNLGDFIDVEDASVAQRHAVADRYEEMWGRRWIVLPNPQYGSWEGAAIGYRYGAPVEEKVEAKRSTLDPRR